MTQIQRVEISHRTIIFTVFFLIFLWGIYQIRGVILLIFISVILMSALNPGVDFLEKFKIPRLVSVLLFYAVIIGFVSSVVAAIIPALVDQTAKLIAITPQLIDRLRLINIDPTVIVEQLSSLPSNVFRFALSAVENVIVVFTVLVFTIYLLIERKNLKHYLTMAFGGDGEKKAEAFVDAIDKRLGRWVRGKLLSMVLVGLLSYAGLQLLGVEFALSLALLAGILEIIPNIGPFIAAIPAVLIALTTNPSLALGVAALYFVVQQLEAQVITPNVMRRAIGFNPLVTIIALLAGFSLAGIGGAILSVPALVVGQVVIETIYDSKGKAIEKS